MVVPARESTRQRGVRRADSVVDDEEFGVAAHNDELASKLTHFLRQGTLLRLLIIVDAAIGAGNIDGRVSVVLAMREGYNPAARHWR